MVEAAETAEEVDDARGRLEKIAEGIVEVVGGALRNNFLREMYSGTSLELVVRRGHLLALMVVASACLLWSFFTFQSDVGESGSQRRPHKFSLATSSRSCE